jgi:hypothetical protein
MGCEVSNRSFIVRSDYKFVSICPQCNFNAMSSSS